MSDERYQQSRELLARAERVVPGGIYGHQNPQFLTRGEYPAFLSDGKGCRVRDVDGNEYIDFICAYGPIVLGYRHPKVEEAVERQRTHADTMNLPGARFVELAERLVEITPGADWALFAKNGSDVCTWALAIARAATRRDLVAAVDGAYHGIHGWCNHIETGFPASDRAGVRTFPWGDLKALEDIFAEERNRIAAVIVTPFRHEAFHDSVMPPPGFLHGVREICDREGAALVVDDVRAGFRLHVGGSTRLWDVTPDLLCYSKAIANGYPLSALLGADAMRDAARSVFVTGTFFMQSVPFAASLATIDEIVKSGAIERMEAMGKRFCEGLVERAGKHKFEVTISGPPAMPFMTFRDDDGGFDRNRAFAGACARRGVFLHPVHNWFLSAAHREADIDEALEVAAAAFAEVRSRF
jgi:glutamate-1-semialdehyde 2,1-aminomutase